ncbi:MAG: aminopeptidase family protein P [Gammaproteobacteria bacterium]|nr:aminopeptidase family protein P [Gammaproteobacteria bacterium]
MTSVSEKLEKLRRCMVNHAVDFYYVPTRDDHNNEYVPAHWQRRDWLTGFTGSYGEALIGLENAYLWTDPRYYLQAEQELDHAEFQLMKQMQGISAPVSTWLGENAFNATVAVDPKVIGMSQRRQWADTLSRVHGTLTAVPENWVDQIWDDQPAPVCHKIHVLDEKYTGYSAADKLSRLRVAMKMAAADALVISQLDEIAWVFNIRGNDIPFNPLVISYAIVTMDEATLFVDLDGILQSDLAYFAEQNITLLPYDQFCESLRLLDCAVWVDPATTSWWVELQLDQAVLIEKASPILLMKAIKNATELKGMREAHRIDAIAVVKFLLWINNHWRDGVDEISASDQLEKYRREDQRCKGLSFSTICGFADHGAIVHYHAMPATKYKITDQNIVLLDSGGQYFEGTTDITRTFHLGVPTAEQQKHYTLVLKGHLALRHTPFPDGACGEHINTLARKPLWEAGMDFGHGTGHGVGSYLCVHEGPQRIGYGASGVPLKPGMIVSNEPGLYFAGKYGIRIENLCEIIEKMPAKDSLTGDGPFYSLKDLTLVPYARELIDINLLSTKEIKQINDYHQEIFAKLSPDLSSDVLAFLKMMTLAL